MEKAKFRYKTEVRVRNYEVDWQGIVHNATYLLYCEVGRIEYLKSIGAKVDIDSINGDSRVVLVRNEIDYQSPAHFDDLLNVYTRTSFIRNTSFAMESMIEHAGTGELVATNVAYHVWLDPVAGTPMTIGSDFRRLIQSYEGTNCEMIWPSESAI